MLGPDELPHYVAFHLGHHCFPKCIFTRIKNEKDKVLIQYIKSSIVKPVLSGH